MINIVISLRPGWLGVRILAEVRKFSLLQIVVIISGAHQPSIQCVPGFLPTDKAVGAWCRPLMPSNAEFKNEKIITLLPLYVFMAFREITWLDFVIKKCLRKPRESPEQAQTCTEHTWNATALPKRKIGPSTWATIATIASLRILLRSTIKLSIDAT